MSVDTRVNKKIACHSTLFDSSEIWRVPKIPGWQQSFLMWSNTDIQIYDSLER